MYFESLPKPRTRIDLNAEVLEQQVKIFCSASEHSSHAPVH